MRTSTLGMHRLAISHILDMQTNLAKTQTKIATGKKIANNHEDPIASSRIKNLRGDYKQLKVYSSNATTAESRIHHLETTLTTMITLTEDVYQLHKKSINGALTQNERTMIGDEMQVKLDEMMGLANTKDEKGESLFAGFQSFETAYTKMNGQIQYHGDQGQRFIQVSSSTFVPVSESGDNLFNKIRTGNGDFTSSMGATPNSGTGVIFPGSVVDFGGYSRDKYTIEFVTNSNAELAYTVTGATSGQVLPPPPALIPDDAPKYVERDNIIFNGHETTITGQPKVGDTFEVNPSGYQNVFTTMQNIIDALHKPATTEVDKAEFYNHMLENGAALDRSVEHMLSQLTRIGSQSSIVDNESRITSDLMIQNQQTLSSVQDIDYATAISELSLAVNALQAAQMSYTKMQNLSLMNMIK